VVVNNLRFPGQYEDAESGLCYNLHRYYELLVGRYLTTDPIGFDGGMNLYGYCFNDPVFRIDPHGLASCDDKCTKIFMMPYRKKTGYTESGTWFDQAYAGKCYYRKMERDEMQWFIKEFYICRSYIDKCGKCEIDRVYLKTEDRGTSKKSFTSWRTVEIIIRNPISWNPVYRDCPTDLPKYRGSILKFFGN